MFPLRDEGEGDVPSCHREGLEAVGKDVEPYCFPPGSEARGGGGVVREGEGVLPFECCGKARGIEGEKEETENQTGKAGEEDEGL